MKYLPLLLLLTGCATGNNEVMMKALGNLEHCDRQYIVALGAGASGSMVINCKAAPFTP